MGKRKRKRNTPSTQQQLATLVAQGKKGRWWEIPAGVLGFVGTVLTIAGFVLNGVPKLSVDVAGSVQPTSPMGTVFYLSNDGALPIHNVEVTMGNIDMQGQSFSVTSLGGELVVHPMARAEILSPGHKMTLPYPAAAGFTAISNFTGGRLNIKAHYRPDFLPWHKAETFPFEAIRTANGNWIWRSVAR